MFIEFDDETAHFEALHKKDLSIYDYVNFDELDRKKLLKFYTAQKKITVAFSMLHSRLKRKNFNPKGWFSTITKVKS